MNNLTANEIELLKLTNEASKFWTRVKVGEPHQCWEHKCKSHGRAGHVRIALYGIRGKRIDVYAHRVAWNLTHGVIPEGLMVLHKCNNPKCCNPAHLYLGTESDNAKDRVRDGSCNFQKFDAEVVDRINLLIDEGYQQKVIAEMIGCTQSYVSIINSRRMVL